MDYEMMKEFIKPELLILIPVIYAIGVALKKSQKISDSYIPIILGIIGIILASIWCISTCTMTSIQEIFACIFVAVTQGILCASGSVFVNQIIKQTTKSSDRSE